MPKTNATAHAVQAPVTGRGTATNGISPRDPYFSIRSLYRLVREKSQSKNLSNAENRRSQFETGSRKRSKSTTGSIFPTTERRKAREGGIPKKLIANGMEVRSSPNGTVAIKTTCRLSNAAPATAKLKGILLN
ncbi:MAG: hypothetical protein OCU12_03855 [Methanophagales archaeon]|nr:hypothetical protein [Methanophagales archaeon]